MEEHFLKWINIVDFKGFHDFEVTSLERVNLIGGKNNIGKTAFLEACLIHIHSKDTLSFFTSIFWIKYARENMNLLSKPLKDYKVFYESIMHYLSKSNIKNITFEILKTEGRKEYFFKINDNLNSINANEFSFEFIRSSNIRYIDNFGFSDDELIECYKSIQENDKENELNTLIHNFDSTIDAFKVIGDKPQCKFQGEYIDLTEFGDGLKHYISIICALYACENGQLFIDEIDNGIHYTQLQNIWELILNISNVVHCQVFATTHSKECIEAFNKANSENDGGYFEFYRDQKKDRIAVMKRDHEQLSYSLTHGGEVRGE
jgi:AAA15 family ATPase/GTPase